MRLAHRMAEGARHRDLCPTRGGRLGPSLWVRDGHSNLTGVALGLDKGVLAEQGSAMAAMELGAGD